MDCVVVPYHKSYPVFLIGPHNSYGTLTLSYFVMVSYSNSDCAFYIKWL